MLSCRSEVANESHRSFCEEQKKINKWGYEFSTKMRKELCIVKSPLVITQSQNFAKGTPHGNEVGYMYIVITDEKENCQEKTTLFKNLLSF